MWVFDTSLFLIALRTLIIYFVILLGLRLAGKREVGQMTPFDLVLLLLISNAVQNAMTGPDTSVSGGLVAAITLLALNWIVNQLVWRYRSARNLLEGSPTLLVYDGKPVKAHLEKEKISTDILYEALREHGVEKIEDVRSVVLEIDGSISVLRYDDVQAEHKPHRHFRFLAHKNQS